MKHSFIKSVEYRDQHIYRWLEEEPFRLEQELFQGYPGQEEEEEAVHIKFHFFGNYQEPAYELSFPRKDLRELSSEEAIQAEIKYDLKRLLWL